MNAVEKLLSQGLASDPSDIAVRLELAEKFAARGANAELAELIAAAPNAPESSAEMHRFLELASQAEVEREAVNAFVAKYVASQPADAWGHHVHALGLSRIGDMAQARRHYDAACKLDPSLSDATLEALLSSAEQQPPEAEVEVEAEAAVEVAAPREEAPSLEGAIPAEETPVVPAARPLRPRPKADAETEAEPEPRPQAEPEPVSPAPVAAPAAEQQPAAPADEVAIEAFAPVAAAADGIAVAIAEPASVEASEYGDHEEEHERGFIVGEGELVHAHDKDPDTKEKLSAVTVAIMVHVGLIALVATWVISMPPKDPPLIVGNQIANLEDDAIETQEIEKKIRQAPVQSASAQVQVMTVTGASSVAIPEITTDLDSFDPVGIGDSLGMSMSFDAGVDGGMVSFFGARTVSKRVVFVVDYSASMRGDKDKLMRAELEKSVKALPNGVEYQLIFFSGPAWYAGQQVKKKGDKKDKWYNDWVVDGSKEYKWYGGWDEDDRAPGGGKTAILFHYAEGDDDKLPTGPYIKASKANLRKSVKHVQETPLSVGTDWRSPLKMAMNMEPDTIYFMTDGAFGTAKGVSKKEMIDDLLAYNRKHSKAKINTICMMVLQARDELEQLADGSRGEFSLVEADGTVLRGRDLDRKAKAKGKPKK